MTHTSLSQRQNKNPFFLALIRLIGCHVSAVTHDSVVVVESYHLNTSSLPLSPADSSYLIEWHRPQEQ